MFGLKRKKKLVYLHLTLKEWKEGVMCCEATDKEFDNYILNDFGSVVVVPVVDGVAITYLATPAYPIVIVRVGATTKGSK